MNSLINKFYLIFFLILTFVVFTNAQDTTAVKQKGKGLKQNEKPLIQHGKGFVDKDGDGYNDNAPDHDGDGIPNGLDPDYTKSKLKTEQKDLPYVDLNGDGINDNLQFGMKRKRYGQKQNNKSVVPQTGTQQNGNGQKGKQKGKGNK